MTEHDSAPLSDTPRQSLRSNKAAPAFPVPLPLFVLQPLLRHIVTTVAGRHPDLFERLGDSQKKKFLIDARGLPLVLVLQPDGDAPQLHAHNRHCVPPCDVRIAGSFPTLLRMIDGQTDSDALFFSRDLSISGDTEASVALRNAIDDLDTTLAEDVVACFGPLAGPVRAVLDYVSGTGRQRQ
ncbi:MAG: hypothetical protein GY789_20300 [Hyphomicrobiales bacterium]|nr:hypothetical protein [Hyphomicrobiales bacterium]MCP4999698.1 hypothetical protein [Hyphomicrobiales bacterium]